MNVRVTALTAMVVLALAGCSQRAANTLPAVPSGAQPAAPAVTRAQLTRSLQLVFPSPGDALKKHLLELDAGEPPALVPPR